MFKIVTRYYGNYPDCSSYNTTCHLFFGQFGAVYMGKEYASCKDVMAVEVINMETGELLYYKTETGEIYEAE